ncbi:MAG: ATP-binding protein, partial [Spirochaetes bacterium]|nr:ATP-binding protein [Spirochaetota bacterium]
MKILETQYGGDFVGRKYDIEEGKKKIRDHGVVVLTGNRGIGKTNLMRVLEEFFKYERECHYIESGFLFSTEISRYFLPEKVSTGFSHSAKLFGVGGGAGRSWIPREETILEGMEKSEEMIVFVENAHELRKEDMEIIFAGTGRNNKLTFVLEIARPYYDDANLRISPEQVVELGKLADNDIGKIVDNECLEFSGEFVGRIVSLSNGYPYIARSLAYICEKKDAEAEMLDFLNTLKDVDMEHTLNSIHKGVLATLD